MKLNENNNVIICGEIASGFELNHSVRGEDFYRFVVKSARLSGTDDMIPVLVSARIFDTTQNLKGLNVSVYGEFRSRNYEGNDGKTHLSLFVFARKVEIMNNNWISELHKNHIHLRGVICKAPVYRKTPIGREITDVILAINRAYRKTDCVPCLFWGRNALYASHLDVGTSICLDGRIQSRIYNKRVLDKELEERIAYEVSAKSLEACIE